MKSLTSYRIREYITADRHCEGERHHPRLRVQTRPDLQLSRHSTVLPAYLTLPICLSCLYLVRARITSPTTELLPSNLRPKHTPHPPTESHLTSVPQTSGASVVLRPASSVEASPSILSHSFPSENDTPQRSPFFCHRHHDDRRVSKAWATSDQSHLHLREIRAFIFLISSQAFCAKVKSRNSGRLRWRTDRMGITWLTGHYVCRR